MPTEKKKSNKTETHTKQKEERREAPKHTAKATKPLYKRIAIVLDWDDTLAPDSVSHLSEHFGVNAEEFWQKRVQPLREQGWDPMTAAFYCLIEESRQRDDPDKKITKERIAKFGRNVTVFDGAPQFFDRMRRCAKAIDPEIEVEFYLITAGIQEIAQNSPLAKEFTAMWGCTFHYEEETGEICFMRRLVSHTEKTRYLYQIARGIDQKEELSAPFKAHHPNPEETHVPLTQMIYIGDGHTDIPCFSAMNKEQGLAIGLLKKNGPAKWGKSLDIDPDEQVENLAPVDYSEHSELMRTLTLAVEAICKHIQIREMSVNE